ncbi:MAG TPA: queuosine precursor transporter [Propionibacteriaceae bacterium]
MTTLESRPRPAGRSAAFATSPSGIYAIVVALFCGLLLISNVAATKTITVVDGLPLVGGIFTDGGALLFPLTYVIGDVLAEVYGLRQARRAIWVGFALAALAAVTFLAVGAAPPGPGYENQAAFQAVLGFVPRIVLASLCGYLAGQFLNAYVVVKLKERARERRLWVRLVGSTVVGELADTVLFCFIAFVGIFPTWGSLISYTVTGYVYKVAVEVILLPVTYAVIRAIKRREPGYAAEPSGGVRDIRLVIIAPEPESVARFTQQVLRESAGGEARLVVLDSRHAQLELVTPGESEALGAGEEGRYRVRVALGDRTELLDVDVTTESGPDRGDPTSLG